jgi:hypothetical protein
MAVDIDPKLEQIAELLDQALQSEDQRVKDALRALLTITVLCSDPEAPKAFIGPFKTLIDDVTTVKKHVVHLEDQIQHIAKSIRRPDYYESTWENRWGPPDSNISVGYPSDPFKYYKDKR